MLEKGTMVAADLFCSNTSCNKREGTSKLPSEKSVRDFKHYLLLLALLAMTIFGLENNIDNSNH